MKIKSKNLKGINNSRNSSLKLAIYDGEGQIKEIHHTVLPSNSLDWFISKMFLIRNCFPSVYEEVEQKMAQKIFLGLALEISKVPMKPGQKEGTSCW